MKDGIMFASQDEDFGSISTGLPTLNRILGETRGIPIGKVSVFTGNYSVGKSTLALFCVREAQKKGIDCLWADSEMTFSKQHAKDSGVNIEKLKLLRKRYAEELLDSVEDYLTENKNVLAVLDSYSGLCPRKEMEKSNEGFTIAGKSRLIAKFFRKVKTHLYFNQNTLIVINHQYANIMGHGQILAGGDSMQKTPSLWIDLAYKSGVALKQGDMRIGDVIISTVKKNENRRSKICKM